MCPSVLKVKNTRYSKPKKKNSHVFQHIPIWDLLVVIMITFERIKGNKYIGNNERIVMLWSQDETYHSSLHRAPPQLHHFTDVRYLQSHCLSFHLENLHFEALENMFLLFCSFSDPFLVLLRSIPQYIALHFGYIYHIDCFNGVSIWIKRWRRR
jgi:hypothetical protein